MNWKYRFFAHFKKSCTHEASKFMTNHLEIMFDGNTGYTMLAVTQCKNCGKISGFPSENYEIAYRNSTSFRKELHKKWGKTSCLP